MYEQYWKLSQKPFDSTVESQFFFPCECHQGALLKLRYAIENRRGASLLTGGAGLGKTLLVSRLAESLDESVEPFSHVVFPKMPTEQLVNFISGSLMNCSTSGLGVDEAIKMLQGFLQQNTISGRHAVLVVDEAHLLNDREQLEMLRLMLNFQSGGEHDLSILLVGQPEVIPSLRRSSGLDERMSVKCLLRPLTTEEAADYINHRLAVAGASRGIFTPAAIDQIYRLNAR